jgi:hypothetical protein
MLDMSFLLTCEAAPRAWQNPAHGRTPLRAEAASVGTKQRPTTCTSSRTAGAAPPVLKNYRRRSIDVQVLVQHT